MRTGHFRPFRYAIFLVLPSILCIGAASASPITLHYNRPDGDYEGWTLWTWGGGQNRDHSGIGKDEFGLIFEIETDSYGSEKRIGVLPKFRDWESKDDPDRFWTTDLGDKIYLVSADKNLYPSLPDVFPRVLGAMVDDKTVLRIVLSKSVSSKDISAAAIMVRDGQGESYGVLSAEAAGRTGDKIKIINVTLSQGLQLSALAGGTVAFADYKPGPLIPAKILDRAEFSSDSPMGALYDPGRTVFRVFAPTALGVTVNLYDEASGGSANRTEMSSIGRGVWEADVSGDLKNKYYTYTARMVDGEYEAIDPYARSTTSHRGRGEIIDDHTPVSPGPVFPPQDAVLYEMHLRDFTIDPAGGVSDLHRGKYMGLTEEGTRLTVDTSVSTAVDHLKELGANVVQIMPFHDFDNNEESDDYNWGYMPVHYFSPEGWYATRRNDATRVREVKMMIDALHRAGIKVVMDVVYNHTAEGNSNVRYSFNGLAPNYYYRCKDDGSYWNGSGCGNEFRTESPMGRKYILDSVKYWMSEYGVDGFRFDLMGLIDLETVKQVVAEVRKIKPDALIYGEPWAGGNTPIDKTEKGDQRGLGFAVFNDNFRDAIKGGTFNKDPGFVQDGRTADKIKRGIKGSIDDFAMEPTESVNYIEAHDNNTLWDRLGLTTGLAGASKADRIRMDELAAALIFTSQGIPFLQAGQEMLRTKNNEDNTYNKPDTINEIHWIWKKENHDVFDYYRGLIGMRLHHPMFRMASADDVRSNLFFLDDDLGLPVPSKSVAYVLHRGNSADEWANALLLFNASASDTDFSIPPSEWFPAMESLGPDVRADAMPVTAGTVRVPARTAAVFFNTDADFYDKYLKRQNRPGR